MRPILCRASLFVVLAGHFGCGSGAGFDIVDDGGSSGDSGTAGGDGGTGSDAARADAAQADAGGDGGNRFDASQSCPAPEPAPPASSSPGTVTFVLTNSASVDRFVVTKGQAMWGPPCVPFGIDTFSLSSSFSCGCECPAPSSTFTLTRVKPGAAVTFPWDGTHVVSYIASYTECAPSFCAGNAADVTQAAAPGEHTAKFIVTNDPPPPADYNCHDNNDGTYGCRGAGAQACTPDFPSSPLEQKFTLPASGNGTVAVAIP
jgi:hypothetical protein